MRKTTEILRFFAIFVVVLFVAAPIRANDGVFYVQGSNLIPLQETQIELRKEVLKFFVTDHEWMRVDVDFRFYNPGKTKEVTVGFVTPPESGDVDEENPRNPQIKDFTVNVNGRDLPFKIARMQDTTFKFGELGIDGYDFVYYFKVRFDPGETRVRHTYKYLGGASVEIQRDFQYQITTGKRWANKQIDDFEMEVHLDTGVYTIPASFKKSGEPANWEVVGHGVIDPMPRSWFGSQEPKIRMAHLNRGYLRLREKNFKPDNDILFAEYNWAAGWISRWCDFQAECVDRKALEKIVQYFTLNPWDGIPKDDLRQLSKLELKYLRNYFYALRGYDFKSVALKDFYSQFFWYKPDPELGWDGVRLTSKQEAFVKKLKEVEAGR